MITYPTLKNKGVIGITAPSSGISQDLHKMFQQSVRRLEEQGYNVICGDTVWTQEKAKSASALKRASEFNSMMMDNGIDMIFPPWGGELLIEILEHVNFDQMKKKWILGYSDTSALLLATTLSTGIATAHGTNSADLRGQIWDDTTAMWEKVLALAPGESITQFSSEKYQKAWQHENPTKCVFHLEEETLWKTTPNKKAEAEGRLLGGCIDIIRHLVGTPFGNVANFRKKYTNTEPLLWYFENCSLSATDLRRSLVQMKLAGWFNDCSAILFGRSAANASVDNYTAKDVYYDLSRELDIPIVYDIDCGHMPPQLTFINGAYARIESESGKGKLVQHFI
ncbi:S66 peptidase family protein [Bacillus sp. MUM 13]|uniref:S66 family peptidase n=1 Tax=Bacillus sp. MUM 13 TaxID=1678001 RepID=UPI0008F5C9F4|nr:S66 peptidase family protein [Bacillus sp. MUM 13]OIK14908.1 LD-carboxypeptidase [Bacillus sp. MUM 13]